MFGNVSFYRSTDCTAYNLSHPTVIRSFQKILAVLIDFIERESRVDVLSVLFKRIVYAVGKIFVSFYFGGIVEDIPYTPRNSVEPEHIIFLVTSQPLINQFLSFGHVITHISHIGYGSNDDSFGSI